MAEEKEKIRRLEVALERGEVEEIKKYQSSQDFLTLMDEEYTTGVNDSFESCWEKVIGVVGAKIPEVTLEMFPVSGASPTICKTSMA